ncbi:hypothetical protein [Actinomycetospora succinea]|uniref:hypothetical protein n=1 Tax=Actinomycetospora succinea TaxID=663603 RepID=UPI0031F1B49E
MLIAVLGLLTAAVFAASVAVTLSMREATAVPSPAAAPAPLPAATTPASPVVATSTPSTTRSTTTTASRRTTTSRTAVSAAECDRIAMRSDVSNAELRPYLRSIGCDDAADGLLVGSADGGSAATEDPGEFALAACTEQTGMTRAECIADSAAGNAN